MAEIVTWANTPAGIKARQEKPDGFKNIKLHYQEHKAALAAQQAQNMPQPQAKPISEGLSLNFKDLPIDGQVQVAKKFGIQLNPATMQAEEQQDHALEMAKAQKPPEAPGAKPERVQ
ncbi:MAG: hypothetical protein HRJ53_25150 [Acidobacteria bacterium Pan2503]|uniref:Uncharacterized protein n=1 Tax=Candidatus Acidiferrum panamense TaxID=2741543 RepID=A0A7V8NW20_9BACT|nr:hypothetical protein [Candidatus Acidoferrum panamensis]